MSAEAQQHAEATQELPNYNSILLAVDSSDHSNRGIVEAVELAHHYGSRITAAHVYAAKLHDIRFRQMEGGLPEQFREEQELERQRDVHDDLITRGLSIITDSYLDQVDNAADKLSQPIERCSLEGKNYRELVNETNSGNYDLLVIGALGLGAVKTSRIGTVCQRVVRRSTIDTLVIKEPTRAISDGPIVVGVDGSTKAYGGLLTALSLAKAWNVPVKVVSAFDPYYHYVAFNRIAGVLSEEAGQVFKFQEQEKLHEEIIDSGLAKIYQGHLSVAQAIAQDHGMEVETVLLDGKPHDVIARYLNEVKPSLFVMGTTGIHADPELDIGGNTEYLLGDAPCAVLLSQREHRPQVDRLAAVTTSWTNEAEERMERVPSFVRSMARMAILRYAQEKGHTVITEGIVEEATAQLMPGHAEKAMEEIVGAYDRGELKRKPGTVEALRWSEEATRLLLTIKDLSLRGNLSMRAEKKARAAGVRVVEAEHIQAFLGDNVETGEFNPSAEATTLPGAGNTVGSDEHSEAHQQTPIGVAPSSAHPTWQAAALARLMRVPEGFMRDSSRQRIEEYARANGDTEITLEIAEAGLAEARKAMAAPVRPAPAAFEHPYSAAAQMDTASTSEASMAGGKPQAPEKPETKKSACPFANLVKPQETTQIEPDETLAPQDKWSPEAEAMLGNVPPGFCRDMTRKAAETIAKQNGLEQIDPAFVEQVMQTFQAGSESSEESMPWEPAARDRISRAPDMVRGMLIKEIEGWSQREGLEQVTEEAVDAIKQIWAERGVFHLDPDDPRNS